MAYSRQQLEEALYAAADRYSIDRNIAYRQIDQESRFNPDAVSPAGAVGIAQFMPDTAQHFGLRDRKDPIASLDAWGRYMRSMLNMFGGRYDLALAGYNSGENRSEYKAAAREGRPINWQVFNTPKLRGVYIETQNYVKTILGSDAPNFGSGSSAAGQTDDGWVYGGWPEWRAEDEPSSSAPPPGPGDSNSKLFPVLAVGIGALVLLLILNDD